MRERAQVFDPRQVMRSDTFEVFHYREPRANSVELHHHDFYEVYYLLDGEVEYWVDGRILRPQAGDLLLINPMELHRPIISQNQNYERIVLWINRDFLQRLSGGNTALLRCFEPASDTHRNLIRPRTAERPALTAALGELVQEYYSREYASDLGALGLLLQFLVRLNRMALDRRGSGEQTGQLPDLVTGVLRYVGEHLAEPLSLDRLAEVFFVSKYHLSHTFSREAGVSLHRYILLRRLLLARQLLGTGESANEVATACGFSDYSAFYRAFRTEYGTGPKAYAEQMK